MTPHIYEYLDAALDLGLLERDFWEMSLKELERYFKSRARVLKAEERKKATYDYILADLIGRSVSRIYNSSNKMPPLHDAYPSLFSEEEIKKSKAERDRQRFMAGLQQFAQSYNKEFEEVAKNK